jgi:hypothetical protein
MKVIQLLRQLHASGDVIDWARGKDLDEFWDKCARGDWLLWFAAKFVNKQGASPKRKIVLTACACAEIALRPLIGDEIIEEELEAEEDLAFLKIPSLCVKTISITRAWAQRKAAIEDVIEAANCLNATRGLLIKDGYVEEADLGYLDAAESALAAAKSAYNDPKAAAEAAYYAGESAESLRFCVSSIDVHWECAQMVRRRLRKPNPFARRMPKLSPDHQ